MKMDKEKFLKTEFSEVFTSCNTPNENTLAEQAHQPGQERIENEKKSKASPPEGGYDAERSRKVSWYDRTGISKN